MSALESLSNPLERLNTLPTAVQARSDGAGDITWDATFQYYRGDIVISPITGGAFIFTGGVDERSAILGGVDPALAPTLWTRLQGQVLPSVDIFNQVGTTASAGAGAAYTFSAGSTITAPEGSTWVVMAQGANTLTAGGAHTDADYSTFSFTPNGVGAVSAVVDIQPQLIANQRFSCSATVFVGVGGTTITPSAVAAGAGQTLTGLRISAFRIA